MAGMDSPDRTRVCSVLFLDIVGYSKHSVADQSRVKQSFNGALTEALEGVAQRDRIIVDTGDGAAVTFLGDPEDALFAALALRESIGPDVRMGINLGAVRLVKDVNGQLNVIGDGINVAQRVMSFCDPGQLLVSRSFYEVASSLSSEYAGLFAHEGSRTDKHVRAHEVYSVGLGARAAGPDSKTGAGRPARRRTDARSGDDEGSAREPARVFDAGASLIISGAGKPGVQEALDRLTAQGCRIISPLARVGTKWMAACEHPDAAAGACKVEELGYTRIVTGPTEQAVADKVAELVQFGAVIVRAAELAGGVWTAVCEVRENRR